MGSETIKLPIIDFSHIKQQTPTWESAKTQVRKALRKALEEYGCFEATFDQIPLDLRASLLNEIKQVFYLPLEIKIRNRSDTPYHGYVGNHSTGPLYEGLGIGNALSPGQIESFTNLLWPEGNPSFSKTLQSFCEQLSELDKTVRRMVVESLGLEKYMDEHMDSTNYLVRFQKYGGPKSHETIAGLLPHTDKNMVSILFQNEISGLELLTKDGHWIPAGASLNSFIVLVGESFHAWTNGRMHPPYHRVMMSGANDRYSLAMFSLAKPGYLVETPEEMVDEEHPLLFKPYDYIQFLKFLEFETSGTSAPGLKDYCGA